MVRLKVQQESVCPESGTADGYPANSHGCLKDACLGKLDSEDKISFIYSWKGLDSLEAARRGS